MHAFNFPSFELPNNKENILATMKREEETSTYTFNTIAEPTTYIRGFSGIRNKLRTTLEVQYLP